MRNIYEPHSDARTLLCPSVGHIIRLDELRDGFFSKRRAGDGFAVRPLLLSLPQRVSELLKLEEIKVCAPAAGAVTELHGNRISLRTGDGLNISVHLGNIDGIHWQTSVGNVLRSGDTMCTLSRDAAEKNGFKGLILTLFTQPMQISELHVDTGFRYKGDRVAYFRINRR